MKSSLNARNTQSTNELEVKPTEDTVESNVEFERIDEYERVAIKGDARLTVRKDGTDLWRVVPDKKIKLPIQLQGSFTSPMYAYEAISNYWK